MNLRRFPAVVVLMGYLPVSVLFLCLGVWGLNPARTADLVNDLLTWFDRETVSAEHATLLAATGAALLVLALQWARGGLAVRQACGMAAVNLVLIGVWVGASLWFNPETLERWQPSVLYWSLGLAIWLAQVLAKQNVLRSLLGGQLTLPDGHWHRMNFAWVALFASMGLLHLWAAYSLGPAAWNGFKHFAGLTLVALFALAQAGLLGLRRQASQEHSP